MSKKSQVLFLSFCLLLFAFKGDKKELIEYDEKQELTWDDYKGRPNKASSFKALTATRISFGANSDGKSLQLSIHNYFEPRSSWTKTDKNQDLLDHERLHFHISELFARKLRKQILQTKFKSKAQKVMDEISKMYEENVRELTKCQRLYDRETDHSIAVKEQKTWEAKIRLELADLNEFSNPLLEISLK